ncbi:MAG: hypothetical protein FJ271_01845 [Planctomycetes bacterium]|nr:hypothetical protein [Planctomycetota bacterium]
MATEHDELFVVFLRSAPNFDQAPELLERPLATCYSYSEARRIQRLLQATPHDCIIRFTGQSGGGD